MKESVRIGKLLSHLGLCTRREAADFIAKNEVFFKGEKITALNTRLEPENESITLFVNEKAYTYGSAVNVYLLHKPPGYVCSHKEQQGQKSIFRLIKPEMSKLFFAGRLDALSRGLVVLSNQGDLIFRLSHPRFQVQKKYRVHASRPLSPGEKEKALAGVFNNNEKLKFHSIVSETKPAHYTIVLKQGKNREIRRVFEGFGIKVLDLFRIELGPYSITQVPEEGAFISVQHKEMHTH